ncbi:MAG: murein transglycosylase A [Thermodesulfobacteriota bacterium]
MKKVVAHSIAGKRFRQGLAGCCLFSLLLIGACTLFQPEVPEPRIDGSALVRLSLPQYPSFSDDMGYDGLQHGISRSLAYLNRLPADRTFWFGADAYTCGHIRKTLSYFLSLVAKKPAADELNRLIRNHFLVYKSKGRDGSGDVLYTGYYEPTLAGSKQFDPAYPHPVFTKPDDLAVVDLKLFGIEVPGRNRIVGRFTAEHTVIPYYERKEIVRNGLKGRAGVIAWVSDPIDLFFLQIQGSGKIYLKSGETIQVSYAASNGRPYKSIGALLMEEGKIARKEMSMQRIREYLASHPREVDRILDYNPSYVFFRVVKEGPIGCLNVTITPGRTVALENRIFPAGCLAFITAAKPIVDGEGRISSWQDFGRFALNQDTGGAIRGPGRADLFWGGGPYAEIAAGHMQHPGDLYFLVLDPATADQLP